jgi:tetratricopeptide (TPR) repeat protein
MRCLEKKAADRWQSAAELVPQLKAMATPSGGVTPTGTQPVTAVSAETAAQRSHPVRVAGLFGLASIGALAVVYLVMHQLGLPDWVFAGAVILLAIGLPIVLLTGHHERKRALARTTGIAVATPASGVLRWFTWRRALTGGGLAFAGLTALATVYMAMRVLGIGPVGTLVAAGVLEERGMLEDRTGDSSLSTSVTEAFRIDLAQSPVVKLMDASAISQVLQRMNRDPGTRVGVDLAREIAEREGVKAIVAGDIGTLGRSYVVSVRLLSSADGTELVALRESAEDDAALIGAVDRLSAKLRERIGESLKTIRAGEPLERVTTASLEALQLYSRAQQATQEGDFDRAIRLLEDAVGLDTAFAMAHRKLGVVLGNSAAGQSRVNAAVTRAYQHRDRLPSLERYLTIAYYYDQVEPDVDRTIDAYRSVLEFDPDDQTALNNLAIQLNGRREWEEAEKLLRHGLATGPIYQMFVNLLVSQARQGKWEETDTTLVEFEARMPDNPLVPWSAAAVAAAKREYEEGTRILRGLSEEARSSPGLRRRTSGLLIPLEEVQGKLASAEQAARGELAAAETEGNRGAALALAVGLARYDAAYRGDAGAAVRSVEEALKRYPIATIPPLDRPYFPIARVYAEAGQPNRARQMHEEWEQALPEIQRPLNERHLWGGTISMAEERYQDAVDAYRSYYDQVGCNVCGLHELARAYDQAGDVDSAVAVYERAVSLPDAGGVNSESRMLASTYIRLGELYEERGDRESAAEYYNQLVELWANADPELQPVVEDVKGRIARLVGER